MNHMSYIFLKRLSFQEIEVRPGIVAKDNEGQLKCTPIMSRVLSLYTEENDLQYAVPGGLIGMVC